MASGRKSTKEQNLRASERRRQKMAADPDYAAMIKAKSAACTKRRRAQETPEEREARLTRSKKWREKKEKDAAWKAVRLARTRANRAALLARDPDYDKRGYEKLKKDPKRYQRFREQCQQSLARAKKAYPEIVKARQAQNGLKAFRKMYQDPVRGPAYRKKCYEKWQKKKAKRIKQAEAKVAQAGLNEEAKAHKAHKE